MRLAIFLLLAVIIACSGRDTQILDNTQENSLDEKFLSTEEVKLSTPLISIDSIFFRADAELSIDFRHPGSHISYSVNADSKMNIYTQPLTIEKSGILRAVSTHPDYISSDTIQQSFVQVNNLLTSADIKLSHTPNTKYPGDGIQSLIDHKKGQLNFSEGNLWCGFDEHKISIDIQFEIPVELNKVHLSFLTDQGSWIFSPEKIKVKINDSILQEHHCTLTQQNEKPQLKIVPITWSKINVVSLHIEIENMQEIPDWHAGAGSSPWLFIDEIIVE